MILFGPEVNILSPGFLYLSFFTIFYFKKSFYPLFTWFKLTPAFTILPPRAMMGIDSCGMLLSAIHEEEGEEKLNLLMVDDKIPAGAKLY